MKKIIILACAIALALTSVAQTKVMQEIKMYNKDTVCYYSNLTANDSFIFDGFKRDITFTHFRDGRILIERPINNIDSIFFNPFVVPQFDIGVIINGITWATRNVDMPGKFAANPEDAGMFYQWDSKIGWSSTDPMINSEGDSLWNNHPPVNQTWLAENDPCPKGWHVPTLQNLESLISSGSFPGELNGVAGHFFGDSIHKLFFPAAQSRNWVDGHIGLSTLGFYWSCERSYELDNVSAYSLVFDKIYDRISTQGYFCSYGHSVRCVKDSPETHDVGIMIDGVKWATRNLAAQGKFVATPEDYGAQFQWGRAGDGHEQRTSPRYPTNDNSFENGIVSGIFDFDGNNQIGSWCSAYGKFIKQNIEPYDWRDPKINTLWNSGTETAPIKTVNDPCPQGWRVPTHAEQMTLIAQKLNWDPDKKGRYFGSAEEKIFLPATGYRRCDDGEVYDTGTNGYYWSSTVIGIYAHYLLFISGGVNVNNYNRADGYSVRCVAE
jgi:uncharacterized protein (TIGR02145 family)